MTYTFTDPGAFTARDTTMPSQLDTLGESVTAAGEAPWTVQIIPWAGGWVENERFSTVANSTSRILAGWLTADPDGAPGSVVGWDIVLTPGTWTMTVIYSGGSDQGVADFTLDGVALVSIDGYPAAVDSVSTTTSITSSTRLPQRLKVSVTTKNASASTYRWRLQLITFVRTA